MPSASPPTLSGSSMRSSPTSGSPLWTTAPPSTLRRAPVAPVASTADCTITWSSWSTSWVAASASPKREFASRSRSRSSSSSESRAWSWFAMSLNAEASSANSSCPFTGTRSVSRPRAIPCAASASPRSVRTIDRPSKYATMETSRSDASSPSRSRSREVAFAASIRRLGAEHGESHVRAVAGGRGDERPVMVAGDANGLRPPGCERDRAVHVG